jgi:hypothetical protein
MIRLLLPERLENAARFQLICECLVRRRRGGGERDRVKNHRLGVFRLLDRQLVHRALVVDHTRALILALEIVVQTADGANVAALALGRANGESRRGVNGLLTLLQLRY